MAQNVEESAKVWQVEAVKERLLALERQIERLDTRLTESAKDQVTTPQLEERIRSVTSSFEDKLGAKAQSHAADIREVNLKYGPLADSYKWITRLIVGLVIAQVIALGFNLLGGR